jgi:hypothetical protein
MTEDAIMKILIKCIKFYTKNMDSCYSFNITKYDRKILNDELNRKYFYIKVANVLDERYNTYLKNSKKIKHNNAKFIRIYHEFNIFFINILLAKILTNIISNDIINIIISYGLRSDFIYNIVSNIDHITLSHIISKYPLSNMNNIIPYLLCSHFEIQLLKEFRIYIMIDMYNIRFNHKQLTTSYYSCKCADINYSVCILHKISDYIDCPGKLGPLKTFCNGVGWCSK